MKKEFTAKHMDTAINKAWEAAREESKCKLEEQGKVACELFDEVKRLRKQLEAARAEALEEEAQIVDDHESGRVLRAEGVANYLRSLKVK